MAERTLGFYLRKLISGSAALSSVKLSTKIVSFILLPVFTYYLTPEDYGIIALYGLVIAFLNILYNPGVISATLRLYYDTENKVDKNELLSTVFIFFIFVSMLVTSFLFFSGSFIFPLIFNNFHFFPYGFLAVIIAITYQPVNLWSTIWAAEYKASKVAFWSVIRFLTAVIISVILVIVLLKGAIGRISGMFIGDLLIFFVVLWLTFKYTGVQFSFKKLSAVLKLGFPLIPGIIASFIFGSGAQFFIEKYLDLESVGLYNVAITIGLVPMMFISGFQQIWTPIFYENMNNKTYTNISKLATYFIIALATVNSAIILFADDFFIFFINENYYSAKTAVPLLVLSTFFFSIISILNGFLSYAKKFMSISLYMVPSAFSIILLNIVLLNKTGFIGGAIALVFGYLLNIIFLIWATRKYIINIFEISKIIYPVLYIIGSVFIFYIINFLRINHLSQLNGILVKITILGLWLFVLIKTNILSVSDKDKIRQYFKIHIKNYFKKF